MILLSDHLKSLSAVHFSPEGTAKALEHNLHQFGPTLRMELKSFREARAFLMPVKSFTTRFIVLGYSDWSLVISDMRDEDCAADALFVSKLASCEAVTVSCCNANRKFKLFRNGKKIREVEAILDGERWTYREEGHAQPFENLAEHSRTRGNERLPLESVFGYFEKATGLRFPKWTNDAFNDCIGLERSVQDLLVQVIRFDTKDDLG